MMNAFALTTSNLRSQGCFELDRKICKSKNSGFCEAVYVANKKSSEECKNMTPKNIRNVCGSSNAHLFDNEKDCINAKPNNSCPENVSMINASHLDILYSCKSIQLELCQKVCGSRYNLIDIRNFFQTNRKPGVACIDVSTNEFKLGTTYSDDKSRVKCLEKHRGNDSWCINYNHEINGINLGAFVQCAGKIDPTK